MPSLGLVGIAYILALVGPDQGGLLQHVVLKVLVVDSSLSPGQARASELCSPAWRSRLSLKEAAAVPFAKHRISSATSMETWELSDDHLPPFLATLLGEQI